MSAHDRNGKAPVAIPRRPAGEATTGQRPPTRLTTYFWSVPWAQLGPLAAGVLLLECVGKRQGHALRPETVRIRRDPDWSGQPLCPSAERYVAAGLAT